MLVRHHYAFLHGFASGPQSTKGRTLRDAFARRGIELHVPDLNVPSFGELTVSGALRVLDQLVASLDTQHPWRLVGSSLGGYLAARWAELNPRRVDRLALLCPGFALVERWPHIVGPANMARWEAERWLAFPDGQGIPTPVSWQFVVDSRRHPLYPEVPCPTLIVHGRRDAVVPIDLSRRYASTRPDVRLVEVDDDHALLGSLDEIVRQITAFFEVAES